VLPWERQTASAAKSEIRIPKSETGIRRMPWHEVVLAVLFVLGLIAGGFFFLRHRASPQAGYVTASSPVGSVPEKSLAVLPFENLSRDPENEFFTDGVQDEILSDLAKVADLRVISRTSVMQYKAGAQRNLREIAQQLGVAHVVEGSVQRAANKVRVIAQLIDARNDAHLWAQTYDRDLADVFAIQSEIAKGIADQLQARLSPAEKNAIEQRPTADVTAFELYSRAKTLTLNTAGGGNIENDRRQAVELLRNAVTRDPAFHAAFCELAWVHDRLYSGGDHTADRLSAAEEALRRATALRPDSPETHLARARHLYWTLRDYKGAETELEIAARGLPNDSRIPEIKGYIVRRQGGAEEGLRLLQQALTMDPRNFSLVQQVGTSQINLRRYAEAAASYDRALQIQPDNTGAGVLRTFTDFLGNGDVEPMCRFVEQVRVNKPASLPDVCDNWFWCGLVKKDWAAAEQALAALDGNPSWADGPIVLSRQFGEGLLARAMHDDDRAHRVFTAARIVQEKLVQQQRDYGPPLCVLGLIDAGLGNKEAALQEGRRAMELLPREKDALNSAIITAYFAVIAAWTGEKDLSLQQLNAAIRAYGTGEITSYGMLKLFPIWDPLRGDARFEQIVASLAPK
jgi:TolB-like protein/Tfp pilus assembly protein PilF